MSFTVENVIPWGRTFDEYVSIFDLTAADLEKFILGCGDGPAGFNAEATRRGHRVISCDPLYDFPGETIERRVRETYDEVLEQLHQNMGDYVWEIFPSPEALGAARLTAMRRFLDDYAGGKAEGRYVPASLPALPFADKTFDLVLCSHFLFLYSEQFSLDFHLSAFRELCRVGKEVRVFPLLTLAVQESPYLAPVTAALQADGCQVRFMKVPYEFQRGGNTMMCVTN